jgi:hypothetical protein
MHIYKYISFNLTHAFQADATRRPDHRHKDVHRVPPRFFDDAPHHPHVRHQYLIVVFSDFCVICISPLEHATYLHPHHANIISLGIHLHIDAHTSAASPRYSDVVTTIHTMSHPDCTFSSGPAARSFTCRVDGMMRGSSCRSVGYR